MIKLVVPEEPKEVKEWMRKNEEHMNSLPIPKRKKRAMVVWYGNKLPQYLWNSWKGELKVVGFTWQNFLTALRFCEEDIISWYKGKLPWNDLARRIMELLSKGA